MKNKKIKILEITILTIIILCIITIFFFLKDVEKDKPEISDTNKIENYSTKRYFKYNTTNAKLTNYNIPLLEDILDYNSMYTNYIVSRDNIIIYYIEEMDINYTNIDEEKENTLKNFCNSYDKIELEYKMSCTYKPNNLKIKNSFDIDKLNTKEIKVNDNLTIETPIKRDTKLDEYQEILRENNINLIEISNIEE